VLPGRARFGYTAAMSVTAPDFSKAPPRRGREMLGNWSWIARMADKFRADRAGTGADYIAYCGLSKAFLAATGVTYDEFNALIIQGATDDQLVEYFDGHCSDAQREAANHVVLHDKAANLDQQEIEEGYR
jgi:hypothetical protein